VNTKDLKDVEQRVKSYWYTDGIAELASGSLFIVLGLYFAIQGYFGESALISVILQVSLVLLMVSAVYGIRWLVNTLKMRLTYPRTGYVAYRVNERGVRQRRWVVAAVALIIAMASMVLVDYMRGLDSIVLVTGILVGVIFIALRGRNSGLKRFYFLGGLAILLGLFLAYRNLPQAQSLAIFYGSLGVAIVISGALVMRRYLGANPIPTGTGHE
jgi:hypothetical protein